MTNDEINREYSNALLIWNAYERTMQSGVLPKAFMFGTTAIVMKKNLMEELKNGDVVVTIDDNKSFEQITEALNQILSNKSYYTVVCRKCFENLFYYRSSLEKMKEILYMI